MHLSQTTPAFVSLPGADEIFTVAAGDGAVLPVYVLRAESPGPALLLGHANGLAAGSYGPWLRDLARDVQVFAFDARGNGGSTWPAGPLERVFAVERFADDLLRVMEAVRARLAGGRLYYLGHSLGAASGLDLAIAHRLPELAAVMLIEPPVFPPPGTSAHAVAERIQPLLIEGARRRRADWPSVEAFAERLKSGKSPFARFAPEILEAHCRATLKPKPGGGFTLCCPPEIEAQVFAAHHRGNAWSRLDQVEIALDLVGADPTSVEFDWIAAAIPEMAGRIKRARLTQLAGVNHLMIQEDPKRLLALVRRWLGYA